ncbi:MAG: penicillin-binding transpeptidase domain-containing protein [Patescibacteria group bacterium]
MKPLFSKKIRFVRQGDQGNVRFGNPPQIHNAVLLYVFLLFMGFSFLILSLRLFQLNIVKGGYYLRLSEENRLRELVIEAKRGTILDRKGFVLAENQEADINKIADRISSRRVYRAKEEAAHLVGYRQIADKADLSADNCTNKLQLGDRVGKKGLEQLFECDLRGVAGKKLVEVDARGKYLKTITVIPPITGKTVKLAVDLDLQRVAYEAIQRQRAAVVALSPKTGEVLVFASSPSFDPQKFEDGDKSVMDYFTADDKPLFNRLTEASYPPGSIFKLFVASGVLEEKKMTVKDIIEDTGSIKAGSLSFGNWYFLQYGKTEGPVDMIKALRRSNDIYFYKAGEKLGPEGIKKWAGTFGLTKKTGIGFQEVEGLIPSPFWKEEALKERWYLGDTYNTSIGQGYTLVSPLQIAFGVLPFANNGYLCNPHLIKDAPAECKQVPVSRHTLDTIREGMKEACSPGGTGWPLFNFSVLNHTLIQQTLAKTPDEKKASVEAAIKRQPSYSKQIQTACKTGTAESHGESTAPHAWFTVFAPFDDPEIMVTVLVEEGGQGSDVAAPIAREILKAYFERIE